MLAKTKKRIEANQIVGWIPMRSYGSGEPKRNFWKICGYPLYHWRLKSALGCKYLDKIFIWSDRKEIWDYATDMSDKFIIVERATEECVEPEWTFVDDLKTPQSRKSIYPNNFHRTRDRGSNAKITEILGHSNYVIVEIMPHHPLETSASLNKLVETYFEDDVAETAYIVAPSQRFFFFDDPKDSRYIIPIFGFPHLGRRQNYPNMSIKGSGMIKSYEWLGKEKIRKVEVPWIEIIDIHTKQDVELAEFYMKKRLEKDKNV